MKEIYADFNDIASDGTLPLTCAGSRTSIGELPEGLKDGEQVRLTDGELSVAASVYQCEDGTWTAHSDWKFSEGGE